MDKRLRLFVTGIDTDIGKTVCSAILCKALGADYWKPVQCGNLEKTDSMQVKEWVSEPSLVVWPEQYCFSLPQSPHLAAASAGVKIDLNAFNLPANQRPLVIEGAGGVLVPLNDRDYIVDIALKFKAEVVVVSSHYLGSLNHTLLTLEALKNRGLTIRGLIFNGQRRDDLSQFLSHRTKLPILLNVDQHPQMNSLLISEYAHMLAKERFF